MFFFFSSRRRHTRFKCDWSSDVCSSDLDNVAPPEKVGGAAFGGIIGYMVILLCLTGGMYPAMDLTAGEKERGTMETILSSPVSRVHLVLGKFFLVLSASLVTAALSVTSIGVSFWAVEHFHSFGKAGSD